MKSLNSCRNIMRGSGLILSVVGLLIFLSPVTSRAQIPSFFQGFENGDTSGWFPEDFAIVNSFLEPSKSSSYNGTETCKYADDTGINAASGSWLGRVTSAVSTSANPTNPPTIGSCTIDTTGPGPDSSLQCFGPFTYFGLKKPGDPNVAGPFPTGGYTIQVDIYLDVAYANEHPDCGTASPVGAPCMPDPNGTSATLGTVNPACTTDPNGIACEGSRFNWTVGLNEPSGNFHRDYVFQVGTAPDPHTVGGFGGCTQGYIINAQYNSFRSGGQPYAGFEPKCITTSGWYTFKEVFTNVSNALQVDWSILPSGGTTPATCKDTTGADTPCTWSRSRPADDPIDQIGCPRYGWLANEEINDLPLDNTALFINGCGLAPLPRPAQITPTNTTCQQFAAGTSATLGSLAYTVKAGSINSVSPGVFFYYTYVIGNANDPVDITELFPDTAPINIQKGQAILYSTDCTKKLELLNVTEPNAAGTLPSTGTFIIGVKYDSSSLKGTIPPTNPPVTYTFESVVNGATQSSATIDLNLKH